MLVFTDGGASKNGQRDCRASWAFIAQDISESGLVPIANIPGEKYQASNNRGELYAIYKALQYISTLPDTPVTIISDSEYSIKCLTIWGPTWTGSKLDGKKNLDIIMPSLELLRNLPNVSFRHVRSHMREPPNTNSMDWFLWSGNNRVDMLCQQALR